MVYLGLKPIFKSKSSPNEKDFLEMMETMAKTVGKERDEFIKDAFIKFMNNDLSDYKSDSLKLIDYVQNQKERTTH